MTNILIAFAVGFVGGIFGAMILVESKTGEMQSKIDSLITGHISIKETLKTQGEKITLLDKAIRLIDAQSRKDKGAIWQSLNDLWIDYDERHKADKEAPAKTVEKTAEKPKKTAKKKQTEEESKHE